MSERTTLEIIAPTVEEALAQGLNQLGLTADAVSVEVMDSGNKGLFGLGGRQVRVRISVNPPPGEEKPAAPAAPAAGSARPKQPRPATKAAAAKPPVESKREPEAPRRVAIPERHENDPLLDKTEDLISKLIFHLGLKAQVSAHYDETSPDDRRNILVDVRGEDLSALIGRQAETLNAFQYVASLLVGKEAGQWVQLIVDVEGYRARREQQIRQLALRMAEQVIKTGRKTTMEPMPSSERRVVHLELRGHPAVMTESTGEEPYRKVVIIPKE